MYYSNVLKMIRETGEYPSKSLRPFNDDYLKIQKDGVKGLVELVDTDDDWQDLFSFLVALMAMIDKVKTKNIFNLNRMYEPVEWFTEFEKLLKSEV